MKSKFKTGDAVQFVEHHHWRGCLGIVEKVVEYDDDCKLLIAVPVPDDYMAYIYVMESNDDVESVGEAVLIPEGEDGEGE